MTIFWFIIIDNPFMVTTEAKICDFQYCTCDRRRSRAKIENSKNGSVHFKMIQNKSMQSLRPEIECLKKFIRHTSPGLIKFWETKIVANLTQF